MEAAAIELSTEMAGHIDHLAADPDSSRSRRATSTASCGVRCRCGRLRARRVGSPTTDSPRASDGSCSRSTSAASTASGDFGDDHASTTPAGSRSPPPTASQRRRPVRVIVVGYLAARTPARAGPTTVASILGSHRRPRRTIGRSTSSPGVTGATPTSPTTAAEVADVGRADAVRAYAPPTRRHRQQHRRPGRGRTDRVSQHVTLDGQHERRLVRRGPAVPQPAPDAGRTARTVAAVELRPRAAPIARRRVRVRRGGADEPARTTDCSHVGEVRDLIAAARSGDRRADLSPARAGRAARARRDAIRTRPLRASRPPAGESARARRPRAVDAVDGRDANGSLTGSLRWPDGSGCEKVVLKVRIPDDDDPGRHCANAVLHIEQAGHQHPRARGPRRRPAGAPARARTSRRSSPPPGSVRPTPTRSSGCSPSDAPQRRAAAPTRSRSSNSTPTTSSSRSHREPGTNTRPRRRRV